MNTTSLNFIVYDTEESIILKDVSSYDPNIVGMLTNLRFTTGLPEFTQTYYFEYTKFGVVQMFAQNFQANILPDGVYNIEQSACGIFNSRFHLRTFMSKCKLKNFIVKQTIESCEDVPNLAQEAFKLMMQLDIASLLISESCAKTDVKYKKGAELYKTTKKAINKLSKTETCNQTCN